MHMQIYSCIYIYMYVQTHTVSSIAALLFAPGRQCSLEPLGPKAYGSGNKGKQLGSGVQDSDTNVLLLPMIEILHGPIHTLLP